MSPAAPGRVWIDADLAPIASNLVKVELEATSRAVAKADRDGGRGNTSPETLAALVHLRLCARLLGQLFDEPGGAP